MKKESWSRVDPKEVTKQEDYLNRREFIVGAGAVLLGVAEVGSPRPAQAVGGLAIKKRSPGPPKEPLSAPEDVESFVNYYELSMDKEEAVRLGARLRTRPWTVTVEGLVKKKRVFDIDQLMKMFPLEERIYRFRCVEGWSMVIPWVGFPLGKFIRRCEPLGDAKFVEFYTLYDPSQLPGQLSAVLSWPYVEGLRMDEAVHPLSLMVVGLYGRVLPAQNGAPLRLMVPWKYGFKSIKSIVRMRFVPEMPVSSWMKASPHEYGFYANVNPLVDHPRWSQAKENRVGEEGLRDTLMFNGYGPEVAPLYAGMDLRKYF